MSNPLGIKRFGPITIYVQNAEHEAQRISEMLAMDIAYVPSGPDQVFALRARDVLLILDGSPHASALAAQYGNHVAEIALVVKDSRAALAIASTKTSETARLCEQTGSGYLRSPHDGEIYFKFIEDTQIPYRGIAPNPSLRTRDRYSFSRIDHIVVNTQKIAPVVSFLSDVFGMKKVNEFTIRVQNEDFVASLYSEVMGLYGTEHPILFPINEPLAGDNESQIPAQLREVGRSHAQHIALLTDSIIESISFLRERGLAFLDFRNADHAACYYREIPTRLGAIPLKEAIDVLRSKGILVDKCGEGYLLQLFSKRMFPEKSVPFLEIIQRSSDVLGCFGDGNFAALAEALEHSMRNK